MLLTNLALAPGPAYANTLTQCRLPLRRRLLSGDVLAKLNGHDPGRIVSDSYATAPADDPLGGMLAADVDTLLPDDFLVKVDRASMAHGLEARPPLLDHELLEMAARIPSAWKVRGGQTKWVFKEAFRRQLPAVAIDRPKQGFEMPTDAWLRGPLRETFEEAVLGPRSAAAPLIDQSTARTLYRGHLSGVGQHGQVLWTLLVLARWAEQYL
jgi:asparagine synthase (glutamine-hydrolysing)